eukprot:COSAG05_NODE_172_length_14980_cov_10.662791_6_plen_192_part_00
MHWQPSFPTVSSSPPTSVSICLLAVRPLILLALSLDGRAALSPTQNMLTPEMIKDEDEYNDIIDDIKEELAEVRSVLVLPIILRIWLFLSDATRRPLVCGVAHIGDTENHVGWCGGIQYGKMEGLEIPRSGAGMLCVFCKFDNSASAAKAKAVLEKRSFDGKQIGALPTRCATSPSTAICPLRALVCVGTV